MKKLFVILAGICFASCIYAQSAPNTAWTVLPSKYFYQSNSNVQGRVSFTNTSINPLMLTEMSVVAISGANACTQIVTRVHTTAKAERLHNLGTNYFPNVLITNIWKYAVSTANTNFVLSSFQIEPDDVVVFTMDDGASNIVTNYVKVGVSEVRPY